MDRNRQTPEYVTRMLAHFGHNEWGGPRYRVVWSETRSKVVGGCWPDGFEGYHVRPEYPGVRRWVVEMWKPPEYSAWQFGQETLIHHNEHTGRPLTEPIWTCGPYPYRGEYKHVMYLEHPKSKAFMPLSPGLIEHLVRLIEKQRHLTDGELRGIRQRAADLQETKRKEWISNKVDDLVSAFIGSAFVGVHGSRGSKTERIFADVKPRPFSGFRQSRPPKLFKGES